MLLLLFILVCILVFIVAFILTMVLYNDKDIFFLRLSKKIEPPLTLHFQDIVVHVNKNNIFLYDKYSQPQIIGARLSDIDIYYVKTSQMNLVELIIEDQRNNEVIFTCFISENKANELQYYLADNSNTLLRVY